VVATNGERHLAESIALGDDRALRGNRVLGLDAARELLTVEFRSVDRYDFEDELIVTDPQPLVDYANSAIRLGGDPALVDVLERRIRTHLENGPVHVSVHPGVLIAR